MTVGPGGASDIESVDAFARQLYRRAFDAGADFEELTTALRSLQRALKHLHTEANDRDSPIYQHDSAGRASQNTVYAERLTSLVQDSDFTLNQASAILDKYESDRDSRGGRDGVVIYSFDTVEMAPKIKLVQDNVVSQTAKIDAFLDTLQLHNPAKTQLTLQRADNQQLDMIVRKVDAIASRLYRARKRGSPADETEDELWQEFKAELEREGFSSKVLRENKVRSGHLVCRPWANV